MAINILDQLTINKIAAGEVIERPSSVVKELVENAIDANATSITVEIKDGGTSFIRITDNGCGIDKKDIPVAFLRHSTSKIKSIEDLLSVSSLGFRGEALSSICAISQVELITKVHSDLMGTRYLIEGGKEKSIEAIGCPDGTTFIVRNLFFNTPARRKFLKSPVTEAGYITDLLEKLAMSHPEISFKFINNNHNKIHTSGNGNSKDIIYHIYGRDISSNLIAVDFKTDLLAIKGFVGKPSVTRGNRNYETYYINNRFIKNKIINKAIEDAFKPYIMSHSYPFTALYIDIDSSYLDVNVHPTKMELRFNCESDVYNSVYKAITDALSYKEHIPEVKLYTPQAEIIPNIIAPLQTKEERIPEFFETKRNDTYEKQYITTPVVEETPKYETKLLDEANVIKHRIIGQLFDTYWLIEYEDKLFIIDQHAAHEKVLYERIVNRYNSENAIPSQNLMLPIIVTLNSNEEAVVLNNMELLNKIGYEIEPFGGKEYQLTAVPMELYGLSETDVFLEIINNLGQNSIKNINSIFDKMATIACKAAVKGNNKLSYLEAKALIDELLLLENPYNCPHGRPTIISMTKYELERKFKRIL